MGTSFTQFLGGAAGNQSVVLTASSTANVLGAWYLFGSVPYPVNQIFLAVDSTVADVAYNILCNIGLGASGSQTVVVSNIPLLNTVTVSGYYADWAILLKVPTIPPNTDIWGQIQSNYASIAPRFSLGVSSEKGMFRTPPQAVGIVSSVSGGTSYATGNGAYGAWTSLGNLTVPARTLFLTGNRAPAALTTANIGFGVSGSQIVVSQNIPILYDEPFIELPGYYPPGEYWVQGYADGSTIEMACIFN